MLRGCSFRCFPLMAGTPYSCDGGQFDRTEHAVCWSGLVEAACQAALKENRLAEGASRARPTVGLVEVTPPRLLFFEILARPRFLFFENLAGAGANRWIGAKQRQT